MTNTSYATPDSHHQQEAEQSATPANCTLFTFVVYAVIFGAMCVFGLVGNTLSFIVLQAEKRGHVATFTLQMMAVMDNLFLASSGLCQISSAVLDYMGQPKHALLAYETVYVWPLVHISQMGAVWTTVFVAFSRYIAICRPFQAHRICTMRRTRMQAAALCIFVVLYNAPRFFEHRIGYVPDPGSSLAGNGDEVNVTSVSNESIAAVMVDYIPTDLRHSQIYLVVYENVFYCLFVYLGPLILLVVLNSCLFRELWASQKRLERLLPKVSSRASMIPTSVESRRRKSNFSLAALLRKQTDGVAYNGQNNVIGGLGAGVGPASTQSAAEENSLTLVTVVIVLFFIICQTPAFVNQMLFYVFGPESLACGHPYFYYFHISNIAVSSNSVLNFLIYCIFRQQFRERLHHFCNGCCCYCCRRDDVCDVGSTAYCVGSSKNKLSLSHTAYSDIQ